MKLSQIFSLRKASWLPVLIALIMASGCNNKKSDKKSGQSDTLFTNEDTTSRMVGTDTTAITFQADIDSPDTTEFMSRDNNAWKAPSFLLTVAQQKQLMMNENQRQLKFKFYEVSREASGSITYGLKVFSTNGAGIEDRKSAVIELAATGTVKTYAKNMNHNRQRLSRGVLKEFYGVAQGTDTPIPEARFQDIIVTLMPDPKLKNNICLHLTLASAAVSTYKVNTEGDVITKPSPPAPPCETEPGGCDGGPVIRDK